MDETMNRSERRRHKRLERKLGQLPGERTKVRVGDVALPPEKGPVSLESREGVYIHAFKCRVCQLQFHVFSWRANRHRVGEVFCPECGQTTPMFHFRVCINENLDLDPKSPNEIFSRWATGYMTAMDDSKF
jgi:hypothetical protein